MSEYTDAIEAVTSRYQQAGAGLALDKSPDEAQRAFELSQASGVPPERIASDIDGFEAQHRQALGQQILNQNPALTNFVSAHPLHGQLINDDLGNLDPFTKAIERLNGTHAAGSAFREFGKAAFPPGRPGRIGFGGTFTQYTALPDEALRPQDREFLENHPILGENIRGLVNLLGIPFVAGARVFSGAVAGGREFLHQYAKDLGFSDQAAGKFANEIAALIENELQKPSVRLEAPGAKPVPREETPPPAPAEGGPPADQPPDPSRRAFLQGTGAVAVAAATERLPKPALPNPNAQVVAGRYMFDEVTGLPNSPRDAMAQIQAVGSELAKRLGQEGVHADYAGAIDLIRSGWRPDPAQVMARQAMERLRPYLEAGEQPPPGTHPLTDLIREQTAEQNKEMLKEAFDAGEKTLLKERSPEKFAELMDHTAPQTARIPTEVLAKNPDVADALGVPPERLQAPGSVGVQVKDLLRLDKDQHKALEDDIGIGDDLSVNEVKELKEIVAYHGSPHDFDKFDLAKVGTGEGVQAYGYGFYLADEPEVAKSYRDRLAGKQIQTFAAHEDLAASYLKSAPNREAAIARLKETAKDFQDSGNRGYAKNYDEAAKLLESGWDASVHPPGRLYQVSIKADPEHFLDWDKPLSQQSAAVREAVERARHAGHEIGPEATGEEIHRVLMQHGMEERLFPSGEIDRIPTKEEGIRTEREVSAALARAGIPGIKYLDQGSRSAGEGSRNYVVFDDSLLQITHKDSDPVLDTIRQTSGLEPKERIVSAATKVGDKTYTGVTHGEAFGKAEDELKAVLPQEEWNRLISNITPEDEGFVTSLGRFVSREEAAQLAESQGQIDRQSPYNYQGPTVASESLDLEPKPPTEAGAGVPFARSAIGRTGRMMTKYEQLIAKRDAEDVEWRLKRAEAQAKRENSTDWKAETERIRSEVEQEVRERPDIAAFQAFDDGQYLGTKMARRPKLARDRLTDDQIDQLPDRFVSDRGLDPDDIANLFGFPDGAELVRTLGSVEREAAGFRGDIVKRLTDAEVFRRVNEKLGETAAERLEEAKDHALSVTQMEMLHEQMLQLATRIGAEVPLTKQAVDFGALQLLNEEIFGSMKSDRYLREAGKAFYRLEKAALEDDPITMLKNAEAQYISARMAKDARKVEQQAKLFNRQAKRFRDREVSGFDTEETAPYKRWVQDILMRLGRDVARTREDLATEIQASADTTLNDFLATKEAMGLEIKMPDFLRDPNFKKPIEEMSVYDARQAMRAVNSLIKVGRDEGKVVSAGETLDKAAALERAKEQVIKSREITGPAENLEYKKGGWTEFRKAGRSYLAVTLSVDNILNRMDHFDPFGFFNQFVGRPLFEAGNYEAKLVREIAKEYENLPGQLTKDKLNATVPNPIFRRPSPDFDFTDQPLIPMTRKNFRAVLLNVGNASNLRKLADGYQLTTEQVMRWVHQVATKADWDWAQAHGNLFNRLWDLAQNMRRRMSGEGAEALEITPIQTRFGTYDGWYHPLIEDKTYVRPSARKPEGEDLFSKAYTRASTPEGYAKSRTGVEYPLSLELDAVPGRFHHEIHDIAFREAVVNASKIIYDPKFRNTMRAQYGKQFEGLFIPWLQDIANSANTITASQEGLARWAEFFRSNAIVTMVGLNPRTIQKHTTTAFLRSVEEVGAGYFKDAVHGLFSSDPAIGSRNWNWAMETFEELQRRDQNYMESISGVQQSQLIGRDWRREMQRLQTLPLAKLDLASAVPTAIAAYTRAIEEGRTASDAIYAGNRAVARAHGSTAITYRPEIMRRGIAGMGGPWIASLYNFMNRIANRQYELAVKAKETAGLATEGETKAALANIPELMIGATVSIFAVALIEHLVTPTKEDKNESWEKQVAKVGLKSAAAPWPVFRDVVGSWVEGKDASLGFANSELKPLTDLGRDLASGDIGFTKQRAGKTIKHATTVFGLLTGLTNAEEGNLAEYLYDLHTGKARPKSMKDWYRGLTKGEPRPRENRPDLIERGLRVIEGGR